MGVVAVGVAAPQVGHSIRLLILAPKPRKAFPGSVYEEPFAILNPIVVNKSTEMVEGWDGCMSIKNDRGYPRALFKRHKLVHVRFFDRKGRMQERYFEGF